jgi:hypothetical protein
MARNFDESVEYDELILLGLGHPDLLERPLALECLFIVKIVLIGLDNVERCTERVGSHSKLYAHCELSL